MSWRVVVTYPLLGKADYVGPVVRTKVEAVAVADSIRSNLSPLVEARVTIARVAR